MELDKRQAAAEYKDKFIKSISYLREVCDGELDEE